MGRLSYLQRQILCLIFREKFVKSQDLLTLWEVEPGAVSDKAKYGSAHASLSRSLSRLWYRNLIEIWKGLTGYRTAVTLTDAGKVLAQAILAEGEEAPVEG